MSNRVAVLTGADGGLGHTVAACLAKDGCRLVLGHPPAVGSTSRPAATSYLVAADVTSETDVRGLIASAVGDFGRIDVLVTLAGVMEQRFLPELDLATWNHTLAINLTGTFLCVSAAAKELRKTGIRGDHRPPARLHRKYQLRRLHRVEGRCRRADRALGPEVRVNCVAPGPIETPLTAVHALPNGSNRNGNGRPTRARYRAGR